MLSGSSLSLTASATALLAASTSLGSVISARQNDNSGATGFAQPSQWLTIIPGSNLGEPINVVISNASDPSVLTEEGFASYASSLYFSPNNCGGFDLGGPQAANLGQGTKNQSDVYRYNFNQGITTCKESFDGGNHFRNWQQASTQAWFLAVSVEMNATSNHMIVDNGYDLGRNYLVGNATKSGGTTSPQDQSRYTTTATRMDVDVDQSSINHGISTDGQVVVLTVTKTASGNGANPTTSASSSSTSGGSSGTGARADALRASLWVASIASSTLAAALMLTS